LQDLHKNDKKLDNHWGIITFITPTYCTYRDTVKTKQNIFLPQYTDFNLKFKKKLYESIAAYPNVMQLTKLANS